ncbi:MAG: alkylhydroperoxidase [Geobacteraceae bacterium GWC2_58_44]|nr:MAG: alkylhydroperoxidase [Geobacteraceae bacterium GWC2_58_44]HBG06778.1 alkylhydroperoxidase [Geobacter sp.]
MPRKPHEHYLKLRERHPGLITAVETLGKAAQAAGPLDEKTVHLIQLGAAAAIRSHGSTHSHTVRALEAGATPEEIRHAVIVLTSTIGFPTAAAALSWVDDVIERGY